MSADVPGYEALRGVLEEAYSRSARGKGQERHANGLPFPKQTICTALETMGQHAWDGQVVKKMLEADRLSEEAGDREILDAIVYLAARVVVRRKGRQIETPKVDPILYQVPSTPPTQEMIEDQKGWLELLNEGSEKVFQSAYLSNPGSAPEPALTEAQGTPEVFNRWHQKFAVEPLPAPALPVNYVLCSHGRIGRCDKCEPPTRHKLFPSPMAEMTCQACNHYWDDHGPSTAGCCQDGCSCVLTHPPRLAPGLGD